MRTAVTDEFAFLISVLVVCLCFPISMLAQDVPISGEAIIHTGDRGEVGDYLESINGTLVDSLPAEGIFLGSFPTNVPIDIVLEHLRHIPHVFSAQPNFRIELPEVDQISQSFPDQSAETYVAGESPESYYEQSAAHVVNLDSTGLVAGGSDVLVAVIDNGVDYSHPLLAGRISPAGFDFLDGDADPSEGDGVQSGHGTFVSGLLCLVAPQAKIVPIRCFDSDGYGSTFAVVKGIYWAIDNGARVLNMSFSLQESNLVLEEAVAAAVTSGVIPVASVGNDGITGEFYPAAYPGVIAVAAIDLSEQFAAFSNSGSYVDFCAPGVNVYSALAGINEWGTWSGTSFSAPLVSGTAALLLSHKPEWTAAEVEEHLRTTARRDLLWGTVNVPDIHYGYGCLSVFDALKQLNFGDGSAFTLLGFQKTIQLGTNITIVFDEVREGGFTVLKLSSDISSQCQTHSLLPIQSPVSYEIATSAVFSGTVKVGIAYDESETVGIESRVSLLQYDNGQWLDITTGVDSVANIIYGTSDNLSVFAVGLPCCRDRVGNVNGTGGDEPTIGDLSVLIDALFISGTPAPITCLAEADINQSGGAAATKTDITIADISVLIDYLFVTGQSLGLPQCL